jgi:hypothetical protein
MSDCKCILLTLDAVARMLDEAYDGHEIDHDHYEKALDYVHRTTDIIIGGG